MITRLDRDAHSFILLDVGLPSDNKDRDRADVIDLSVLLKTIRPSNNLIYFQVWKDPLLKIVLKLA